MEEEKITLEDTIGTFKEILKDAERLSSGNVAHQRVHIVGTARWWIDEITEQISKEKKK